MSQILAAGKAAPDFRLRVTPDQWLSLSDLKGRLVIIALLSSGLEPGVRGPDDALPGGATGVPGL